jgi:hypothetical protein
MTRAFRFDELYAIFASDEVAALLDGDSASAV